MNRSEIAGLRPLHAPFPLELNVIGSLIAGGFPNPAGDYFRHAININEILVTNPTTTYVGYAWSDSMEPLIYEGAILLVDKAFECRNGNYIAGTYDGDWFMKRFWKENGIVTLHSENPNYSPITVREGIQFEIFGKITKVIQSL